MNQERKTETKLGSLFLTFTSANHCCAHTNRNSQEFLTVRGVRYYINAHLYKYADGSWNIGPEKEAECMRRASLHATREGWVNVRDMSPSRSAQDKMMEVVTEAVREFIAANPGALYEAETEHLKEEYEKAHAACEEARAAFEAAVKAKNEAAVALNKHELKASAA